MGPSAPACALVLLLLLLGRAGPEKLCGHCFVRALVRVCGGPRWSPEAGRPAARGDREPLQWLEGGHLQDMVAPGTGQQPLPQAARHRRRRTAASNPARSCCLSGCSRQDLLTLCPK